MHLIVKKMLTCEASIIKLPFLLHTNPSNNKNEKGMLLAGSSLLTLLDDIATLLDDISVNGKLAAKKTAGVLGDDLSLNAQQVSGVRANRELPVVWAWRKDRSLIK